MEHLRLSNMVFFVKSLHKLGNTLNLHVKSLNIQSGLVFISLLHYLFKKRRITV